MSKTLELTTPIEAHGETLKELKFRELTVEDMRRCGDPFKYSVKKGTSDMEISIDSDIAAKYIVRLAGIPESSVNKMSIKDFSAARMLVMDFFGDAMGA